MVESREKAGVFRILLVWVEADGLVMERDPRPLDYSVAFVAAGRRLPLKMVGVVVGWYCNDGFGAFVPDPPHTADEKSMLERHDM